MSEKHCPSEAELVAFVDADLSPEQLAKVERHLELCSACAKQVVQLSELVGDVAAELPQPDWDVAEHVAGVMERLDAPAPARTRGRWLPWAGGVSVAAAAALFVATRGPALEEPRGTLQARGASAAASLSRDVGVQLYAHEQALKPLGSGSVIQPGTPLTAGVRNLGAAPAYLLLFAIDSRQEVHWIAPSFTVVGSDPESYAMAPVTTEQPLPSAVAFDDLPPGPLRVVSVITEQPARVSAVESLAAHELGDAALVARFPQAEVRQIMLQVRAP